jgi:hypothetical protein
MKNPNDPTGNQNRELPARSPAYSNTVHAVLTVFYVKISQYILHFCIFITYSTAYCRFGNLFIQEMDKRMYMYVKNIKA